ncbi:hypothetical protein [Microbacterium xanthum]|uniref:hypothetical protein n=1 Tax=Microbacterium xanthum TaxID=3079794 RepID=UPI002AD21F3B|nr:MULTISPECIES: hypothetical protein [unclassified Microbacterium]MDZ8170938.1 hypothetical protein [Microbacterium sp. KSW-48]MDZ8201455.1 hypothetical protein [Microbacterium sp. SSW1-59]
MNRTLTGLVLSTSALLALTGCTGGGGSAPPDDPASQTQDAPGDDGQSVAEACEVIAETITSATAQFDEGAGGDLADVVAAMEAASAELATTTQAITNDEVAALLPDLQRMFTEAEEVFQALADGDVSGAEDLEEIGGRFQETGAAFEELCAS